MKRTWNKLRRGEKGQALMLVLILMLLGGLIIAPLLSYMGTGLKAGQVYEERMDELYAADAGIEDALWKIKNSQLPDTPYLLPELVNGKQVLVTPPTEDTMKAFFVGMLNLPPGQENAQHPHGTGQTEWVVVYSSPQPGTYAITITYLGQAEKKTIGQLGAWLWGDIYKYKEDSAAGITTAPPTSEDPDSGYEKYYGGGSVFIWDLTPKFEFGKKTGIYEATQTFEFTLLDGTIPTTTPEPNVGWAGTTSKDIWISWRGTVEMNQLTATATDPTTGKSTTVTSYVFAEQITPNPVTITLLTWDISLQQE